MSDSSEPPKTVVPGTERAESTNKILINAAEGARKTEPRAKEQVRQLTQRVSDLIDLLRTQRDVLRQRGMNLPTGSLDTLKTLKTRAEALDRQISGSQIELNQLRKLADTTALINSSLDPADVLEQVMDTVIHLTGAERGYILMKNLQTGEIDDFAVARGIDREQVVQSEFTVSRTVVRRVVETGEPVLTDDAQDDPRFEDGKSIFGLQLRSILAVPLKVRGNIIGVVYCDNRVLKALFTQHEVALAAAFANQAAVAIENARLFESARENLAQVTAFRDLMGSIFTSIASGVITLDQRDVIIDCNAAARQILNAADEVVGKPLNQVMPEMQPDFYDILKRIRTNGGKELIDAQPIVNGYGRRIWNLIASPLLDGNARIQGATIVLDDLTEQKAREAQLAEVRRYLPMALVENIRSIEKVDVAGEEREISAIFCDVRGFTTFSENLEPEELMRIINEYLSVASDGIGLYEGIVDKYMGDAVTGLFNTQLNPQENHAERAVRAAMSIILDLYALHDKFAEEQRLFFGIGIHTGMAVLGNVGSPDRKEFAALGGATEVSKILQENAGKGEIIISAATYEQVKDLFECEQRVPEKTKGRTDLNVAYRVVKRRKGATTGNLLIDPELADLLGDLDTDQP